MDLTLTPSWLKLVNPPSDMCVGDVSQSAGITRTELVTLKAEPSVAVETPSGKLCHAAGRERVEIFMHFSTVPRNI